MPPSASPPRRVRLFRSNRGQAIRIPVELELPGTGALIYRDGTRLIIEPVRQARLAALLAGWTPLDDDLPEPEDPPPRDIL